MQVKWKYILNHWLDIFLKQATLTNGSTHRDDDSLIQDTNNASLDHGVTLCVLVQVGHQHLNHQVTVLCLQTNNGLDELQDNLIKSVNLLSSVDYQWKGYYLNNIETRN